LQEYWEHIWNMREILIKEQRHRSVQTKLDSFFKPAVLRTGTTSESPIDELYSV
jgi:hypothetical protein